MTYKQFKKEYLMLIETFCVANLTDSERSSIIKQYCDLVSEYPHFTKMADNDD